LKLEKRGWETEGSRNLVLFPGRKGEEDKKIADILLKREGGGVSQKKKGGEGKEKRIKIRGKIKN